MASFFLPLISIIFLLCLSMLPLDTQLSILIHLAQADHNVSTEEREIIKKTGQDNGLNFTQKEALIASPRSVGDLYRLPKEKKIRMPDRSHQTY